jgi:hypothetical protein
MRMAGFPPKHGEAICTLPLLRTALTVILGSALAWVAVAADELPNAASHRAFGPIVHPRVPDVKSAARSTVDRFVLAALEAKHLSLNPEADRATLIRRVCFDLTGLPPTIAEIDRFLADKTPEAYGEMVDRYLATRYYGERAGKLWLDAAGYADSNGYFNADSDRPLAWKYRDYVVRSFNGDKPYDRFVREQLAGDELVGYTPGGDVTPEMADPLVATHFLRNAPDGTGESDGNPDEVRTDRLSVLEGTVQNAMNSLLGLTVQCARCHDHKFEPISQEEYYGLQAIFFPVYNPDRWSKPNHRVITVGTRTELAELHRKNQLIDRQVKAAQDGLTAFAEPLREQLFDEHLRNLDVPTRTAIIDATKNLKEKRTPVQVELLKTHAKAIAVKDDELSKRFPEYAALRDRIQQTIATREKDRPKPAERIAAFVEADANPATHHILKRGQHGQPGAEVQPGAIAAISEPTNTFSIGPRQAAQISTGRRTAFAKWVTSPENPLFARVMVNRIWQQHFGAGIVATADNLGASGAKPSHPDLLDYLAAEFVASGWSIKAMHRLILNSAVYRQSSEPRHNADPDNRLLARYPLRRLDAEAIRDAMLHVSGELDARAGGPFVPSKRNPEGTVDIDETADGAFKRSIYVQQRRTQVVSFLQLFDAPSIVTTCGKRTPSTVPLQSLALLNSEFARARAKALAGRLARAAGDNDAKRIDLAFRIACGRPPIKDERQMCEEFLARQREVYAKDKESDARAWADLCQMVFASNAFLYVD